MTAPEKHFDIRPETEADVFSLYSLSALAFGPGRFARSAYRVREGVAPVSALSLTAWAQDRPADTSAADTSAADASAADTSAADASATDTSATDTSATDTNAADTDAADTDAADGRLVGGVRFTAISVGEREGGLLLGPLVVHPDLKGKGCGLALVIEGLARARDAGFAFVLLVGDMSYYERFGFAQTAQGKITLPGPVDPARLLAVELKTGALGGVTGQVVAHAP